MKKFLLSISSVLLHSFLIAQTNSVNLLENGVTQGQYSSIAAAYAAIPATITQPYIIELTSIYTGASETYPITFTVKAGANSTNTITLRPALGVSAVSISGNSSGNAILTLNDADYVVVDGRPGSTGTTNALTISNTATNSSANTINLINGATNNVIRNCNLTNATTTNAGRDISFGTSVSNTTGNSDNLVAFCNITGGRYMINSNGTAANKNTRNKIYGCNIVNMSFAGIWYQSGSGGYTIDSNRFYCTAATGDGPYAMLFDSATDSVIISRNWIYDIDNAAKTSQVKGIMFRSNSGTSYSRVYNNMISLSSTNSGSTAVYGIDYSGTSYTADIYYNTVRVQGALTSGGTSGNVVSAAFYKGATSGTFNIYNNIFENERTGGNSGAQHVAFALNNTGGTINSDYNTVFASSGNHVRYGTVLYNTLSSFQAAVTTPNEVHTNFHDCQFVSTTDLHLAGTSIGNGNLAGITVSLINTDIDNETRGQNPYRGADEQTVFPLPLDLLRFSGAWKGSNAVLNWHTANERNMSGFTLERSLDGVFFQPLTTIVAKGDKGIYDYTDQNTGSSEKLFYRLAMLEMGNGVRFSNTVILSRNGQISGSISVYASPVPFSDRLNVLVTSNIAAATKLQIMDGTGRIVLTRSLMLTLGANTVELSGLSDLSAGIYYISLQNQHLNSTLRICK